MRGMQVSREDKLRRSVINRILCHTMILKSEIEREFGVEFDSHFRTELARLGELERDGLVKIEGDCIRVAPLGRIFIRNIAMAFDAYLNKAEAPRTRVFSRTL